MFLMTSLHVIYGLAPPPNQKSGYAYARSSPQIFYTQLQLQVTVGLLVSIVRLVEKYLLVQLTKK